MALTPGNRLGPYEILSPLGAGGMGEVYKARDTSLDRDVAIKILPDAFVADPERVARFQREAKTLASLNHPNIGGIYGLEDSGGVTALVMELVEGEDLSQRIARGPIPIDEALAIARQIAEALEAAHEQGVIHRDLKPGNIKVRPDGTVKVLDFGLAKAMDPMAASPSGAALTNSPTMMSPAMTGLGVILGTAAYMSPEQARGATVDKRSDLWAFGVLLWEMLTGKRLFEGATVSDTLAAVLRAEPDWTALPANVPTLIRRLLRRCLEKDRKRRLDSAAAARLEIEEALTALTAVDGADAPPGPRSRRRIIVAASVALLVVSAVAALATRATRPAPTPAPDVVRFTVTSPEGQGPSVRMFDRDVAIAPDGRYLVYQEGTSAPHLVVRAIDQLETVQVQGLAGSRWPFISPDSHWLGFFAQDSGELKKVSITGGPAVTVCSIHGNPTGASWGPDDTIVFATSDPTTGLLSVPAGGGEPKVLTRADPAHNERDHWFPSMLPDGRTVLFTIMPTGPIENAQVAVLDLKTGRTKTLIRGGSQAEYVETGHLIYAGGGTLRAIRFDVARLEVLGDSVPVVAQVLTKTNGTADFSVSRHGTLVHVPGGAAIVPRMTLVWVDRKGHEESIKAPARTYVYPRLSPDGRRVALDIRDQQNDIWIWDLARENLQRLTTDPGIDRIPIWTPDGTRVVFTAEHDGVQSVYWQPFDGSGTMERLTSGTQGQYPMSFSPDGRQLIFSTPTAPPYDLGVVTLGATRTVTMLLNSPADETNAEISPDGRWLAYESNESGRPEIYVRPFPNVELARHQISTGGGTRPLWSRNGAELFYYVAPDTIMAVPVGLRADLVFGNPHPVIKGPYAVPVYSGRHYDVSADGQRFLLLKDAPTPDGQKPAAPEIRVVVNWFEELKRLVPTK